MLAAIGVLYSLLIREGDYCEAHKTIHDGNLFSSNLSVLYSNDRKALLMLSTTEKGFIFDEISARDFPCMFQLLAGPMRARLCFQYLAPQPIRVCA